MGLYYVLEALKWLILARVLISWLPMLGIHLPLFNPIITFIYRVTDPILAPLVRYTRVGMMDLSPIIAFFIITFLQKLLVGGSLHQTISQMIAFGICLVIAFSVHEFAHAWMATRLGDPTPKNDGRLTLDPRKHLDLLGSIMVLTVGFGWAKPVPVNPYNLRNGPKTGLAIVSVVGPLSNLLMAFIASIPLRMGLVDLAFGASTSFFPSFQEILLTFIWLNVVLFVFNLLPIPPLDGFKVLLGFLPYSAAQAARNLEPVGPVILLLMVFLAGPIFTTIISAPTNYLVGLLI